MLASTVHIIKNNCFDGNKRKKRTLNVKVQPRICLFWCQLFSLADKAFWEGSFLFLNLSQPSFLLNLSFMEYPWLTRCWYTNTPCLSAGGVFSWCILELLLHFTGQFFTAAVPSGSPDDSQSPLCLSSPEAHVAYLVIEISSWQCWTKAQTHISPEFIQLCHWSVNFLSARAQFWMLSMSQ